MIPENELGVIVLFSQQAGAAGFEIVSIQAKFPDAIVRKDGKEYRAEFEYNASNYVTHKHSVRKCDLIIAWESDWPECILPVITLSDSDWASTDLTLPSDIERELFYWKQRARTAECKLSRIKTEAKSGYPMPIEQAREARANNKQASMDSLLEYYSGNPGASYAEAGRHIQRSRQTASTYVRELIDAGRLVNNGQGVEVTGTSPTIDPPF